MSSATSHIGLEVLTKFPQISEFQYLLIFLTEGVVTFGSTIRSKNCSVMFMIDVIIIQSFYNRHVIAARINLSKFLLDNAKKGYNGYH